MKLNKIAFEAPDGQIHILHDLWSELSESIAQFILHYERVHTGTTVVMVDYKGDEYYV